MIREMQQSSGQAAGAPRTRLTTECGIGVANPPAWSSVPSKTREPRVVPLGSSIWHA